MNKELSFINKVEVWLASVTLSILIFNMLSVISHSGHYNSDIYKYEFESKGLNYSYIGHYFMPYLWRYVTLYICYLLLHFVAIKNIAIKRRLFWNILLGIVLFGVSLAAWGLSEMVMNKYMYYRNNDRLDVTINFVWASLLSVSKIYALYILFVLIKYNLGTIGRRLNITILQMEAIKDGVILTAVWVVTWFIFCMPGMPDGYRIVWFFIVLPAIPLYIYSYATLAPLAKAHDKGFNYYLMRVVLIACPVLFFSSFAYIVIYKHKSALLIFTFFNIGATLALGISSWFVYHWRLEKKKELTGLKTALGRSSANVEFLRSQINPHFLFNVLNTLYGTAIQENAERTGEGIQRLGDMMRFMLQENVQDQISLTREVDYLNNYIALQKLRTQTSPDIVIHTEIQEQSNALQIPPMLLIPFVENAFKHGISLREPSHIKITLYTKEGELFFDVYNSTHPKPENDPEQHKSGIGLENVKQRLQLIYPDSHELIIRESAKEFFIHLTLQLT